MDYNDLGYRVNIGYDTHAADDLRVRLRGVYSGLNQPSGNEERAGRKAPSPFGLGGLGDCHADAATGLEDDQHLQGPCLNEWRPVP